MALGSNIRPNNSQTDAIYAVIASIVSEWMTAIDAGGMDARDGVVAGTILNPDTDITAADHHIVDVPKKGAMFVEARMAYAGTPNADPVIQAYGRVMSAGGVAGPWERLYNSADTPATDVTLTTATATDVTDGTMKYTAVNAKTHRWDLRGANQVLFAVQTAYGVSAGSAATAYLQARTM